jgi:hypothetical protein
MNLTPGPTKKLLEWFGRNPVIGLASLVIGVMSLGVTTYFGEVSHRSRELSYEVNPTRSIIVKSGQSSDLHVVYKGQTVLSDVTALQVVIWNNGKESIRSENVLTPITFSTSPKVPILEAQIKQAPRRPVTQVVADTSRISDGSVSLSWKILEHNDGALLQLIVAGPTGVTVKGEGVIEGQRTARAYSKSRITNRILTSLLGFLFVTGFISGGTIIWLKAERRFGSWRGSGIALVSLLVFLALIIWGGSYIDLSPVPPGLQ